MKRSLIILAVVAAAIALIVWAKQDRSGDDPATDSVPATTRATTSVILFADPREAESDCGCGQIIRMVRGIEGVKDVVVLEFDPREHVEEARSRGVRVAPTVIIAGPGGTERTRFEGESSAVVAELRTALESLASDPQVQESP